MIVKTLFARSALALAGLFWLTGCGQQGAGQPQRNLAGGAPAAAADETGITASTSVSIAAVPQVSLVAGTTAGDGNTDGYIALSHFQDPEGVTGDAYGNIYVADTGNHTIRRITPNGVVSTVAGKAGEAGSADGQGSQARFHTPMGLRADFAGNLYVADAGNHVIRRVTPDGMVSTVAGKAGQGGVVDGAAAVARLWSPRRLALGPDGTLYVADRDRGLVRKVAPDGAIGTLATDAPLVSPIDGSTIARPFSYIEGIAVDRSGNVYVTDVGYGMVRKIAPDGHVTHVAGKPNGLGPDLGAQIDGVAALAQFSTLGDIVAHRDGSLTVLDLHTVRRISAAGVVTTVVPFPHVIDNNLGALGLDRDGNVLVANRNVDEHHVRSQGLSAIFRVRSEGGLATVAPRALAAPALSPDGEPLPSFNPSALAIGPLGVLHVADAGALYAVNPLGRFDARVLRGDGADGVGNPAPYAMGFDAAGNAYLADRGIYRVAPDGVVSRLPSATGYGAIAVAPDGAVYAADPANRAIYVVRAGGAPVLYAGVPGVAGHADGARLAATFGTPAGLALDGAGNLLVADAGNHTVRRISAGGMVSTIAGRPGVAGSDDGAEATFDTPRHVAADSAGNVYVAEYGARTVRRIAANGMVATVAGRRGAAGITLDSLGLVHGLAAGPDGVLYMISDGALLKLKI